MWIDVNVQKPLEKGEYLVTIVDIVKKNALRTPKVTIAKYDPARELFTAKGEVIGWMPKPEPLTDELIKIVNRGRVEMVSKEDAYWEYRNATVFATTEEERCCARQILNRLKTNDFTIESGMKCIIARSNLQTRTLHDYKGHMIKKAWYTDSKGNRLIDEPVFYLVTSPDGHESKYNSLDMAKLDINRLVKIYSEICKESEELQEVV